MAEKGNGTSIPVGHPWVYALPVVPEEAVAAWDGQVVCYGFRSCVDMLANEAEAVGKIPAGHLVKRARSDIMVSEGNPAPDFTLHTADDQPVSLTAYRGRPVLLVFLRHLG